MLRVFYATDLHGSDVCWRKLINAAPYYQADVVICGGDMTGKAMVPIVDQGGHWEVVLQDQRSVLDDEDQVRDMERRIANKGYYPTRVSPEEMAALSDDPKLVDKRFRGEILTTVERWMDIAHDKLAGTGIRCIVCPGNDDVFEIDKIISRSEVIELGEGKVLDLDGFQMVSMGWTNPTPWRTYREAPEEKLRVRIDRMVENITDLNRAIFNFHVPPYGSGLDEAPALDENLKPILGGRALRPVGSKAVRQAIDDYQPLLSLHGHIHEGKGLQRLGRTLAINPGSAYEEGVLQGSLIELDEKKGKIKNYLLVTG